MTTSPLHNQPAPTTRRFLTQGLFEARAVLRNGEQILVTLLIPTAILIGLVRTNLITLDVGHLTRINFVTPGVLALAIMTTSFTSQAIATAFDRRNGFLRLLATTPLARSGLVAGKVLGVLMVELVQLMVLGGTALALGWRPDPAGIGIALLIALLGTAAFTSLALLIAGTIRAEGVLAIANIVLVALIVGGAVLIPSSQMPPAAGTIAALLPSGALGDALRAALWDGTIQFAPLLVLCVWTAALAAAATRFFRWQ